PTPRMDPIKVCALFDTRIPIFKANVEAIKIAVEEINAAGGILGRKVEFYHEDTQRKVDIAVAAYRKAVLEIGCSVVFVEGVSEEALAIIDEGARVYPTKPHIVMSSQAAMGTTLKVMLEYDKYKFYFRNLPPDPNLNYEIAKWFFDIAKNVVKAKKVALLLEDAAWTECARKGCSYDTPRGKIEIKAMKDWVKEEFGLDVVYVAHVAVGEKNFLPMLEAAKANDAEFIFVLSSWYTDVTTLTKQWAASAAKDIQISFYGGPNQWLVFWKMTGGDSLGIITMMYDDENLPPISPLTRSFIKKMHERGFAVDMSCHFYYSEMYRIKEAMERVRDPYNISAVIKAMEQLEFKNHTTIPHKLVFFGYNNPMFHSYTGGPMIFAQIQCGGKPVYIMRPDLMLQTGFPEEVAKMMTPEAYKKPEELRKICTS
ncbi:MAG: ABC transporter substrate-binding protein, partial [Archaeoglobaceae archaeon]|nr:ABC transporter substrate-binding protein [Archaeoglobaceae archaeon]